MERSFSTFAPPPQTSSTTTVRQPISPRLAFPFRSGPTSLKYGLINSPLNATNQSSPIVSISISKSCFKSSGRASTNSFLSAVVSPEVADVDATGTERFARRDAEMVGSVGFGPTGVGG